MRSSILENIKSLPPLSTTVTEINRLYADQASSLKEFATVVEKDPMVLANLLKTANSPLYGFGKEIKNALQAVTLFGMTMTRSIAVGNSMRNLLNVDMQPYKITSEEFANISSMQAALIFNWYSKISKEKAEKLHLAAFLQETGTILIANEIIQDDEVVSFASEIETAPNIAEVERSYVDVTCAEVTALVFKYWKFDEDFVNIIMYADAPQNAPEDIREYSTALNIVKTIIPLNRPLSEGAINVGLRKAKAAGYDTDILEDSIDFMLDLNAAH